MFWAFLFIAGIVALIKYPSFRKAVAVIAFVLALTIGAYYANDKEQTEASKRLVRADELSFTDMGLAEPSSISSRLTGRVKNNSRYTVIGIKAKIEVRDCDENSKCEVVGSEEENIPALIPPGQVRDIDDLVYFGGGTRVHGRFDWNYMISEIRARP